MRPAPPSAAKATAGNAAELRQRAEKRAERPPARTKPLSPAASRLTLHELQVYQIELEMQNEELRRTRTELEAVRERYFDLYDLAPVGYVTVGEPGLIVESNLTSATLLGLTRDTLIRQRTGVERVVDLRRLFLPIPLSQVSAPLQFPVALHALPVLFYSHESAQTHEDRN